MLKFKYTGSWDVQGYAGWYYIATYPNSKDKNSLVATRSSYSCREYFIQALRGRINRGDAFTPAARRAYALVTLGRTYSDRTHLWQEKLDKICEKSLYIINSFEKEHGWQRTRCYPVECTNVRLPLRFFNGPKRWTMTPYHMSIWTLMIRLGQNGWLPKRLTTLSHENLVRQLAINAKAKGSNSDATQTNKSLRHWDPFMSVHKGLMNGSNRKYHWAIPRLGGKSDRPEGIYKFVAGTTGYQELFRRYNKLVTEAKISK